MGISSPESALPDAVAAMVTRRSLALLVLVMGVTLSLPLVRASRIDGDRPPPPIHSGESSEGSSEENDSCKGIDCHMDIPNDDCMQVICEKCCQMPYPGAMVPDYCYTCPKEPSQPFYLVAQVALGTALVVAIAALMSVILRSCSNRESGRRRRPQIRTSAGSMTSADVYFTERLQDCPPCYDEIRWEKPPSYGSLSVLEENSTDGPARQGPSVSSSGEAPRPRDCASPPPYGGIYTITQRVIQLQASPPTNSDDDRGIIFIAASNTEEADKNESTDEPKESKEAKTGEATPAAVSQ